MGAELRQGEGGCRGGRPEPGWTVQDVSTGDGRVAVSSTNRFNADQVHYLLPGACRKAAGKIMQASAQHMGALSELLSRLLPCTPRPLAHPITCHLGLESQ